MTLRSIVNTVRHMNRFRLILVAAVLCPSVGCEWMKQHGIGKNIGADKDGGRDRELRKVAPEELVGYLNDRADRLQSITNADVRMLAVDRSGLVPTPPITLRGELFAVQPRNFKLTGTGGAIDIKMFLGSNDQQFWVYAKMPTVDPMYVFASHSDFEAGKARIPGGVPFEPEWVLQTLGMAHLPATNQYAPVKLDANARTYTLSWPATTPNGVSVVKEIVFDADPATGTKPQVKKHVVRDTKGKTLCYAEVKEAKTVQTGAADAKGQPLAVQYPTTVVLRWEEPQKFELKLEVLTAQINHPLTPEEAKRHFSRPNVAGTTPVDLARYDLPLK